MKFWDTSALIPLFVKEKHSPVSRAQLASDREVFVWWGSTIEFTSALCRLERVRALSALEVDSCIKRFYEMSSYWLEIQPSSKIKNTAARLLRVHPIRSQDALQLAAALTASEEQPYTLSFISFDERLNLAAQKEGFIVEP